MKYYAVDPFSKCQFCGHTRPKVKSKQVCPTCGQEIEPEREIDLSKCQNCGKELKRLLIGEKTDDRHVFLLQSYPKLNICSFADWKKFLKGKKIIDEDGELINKNRLFYLIRTWPKVKDPDTGKRVKVELLSCNADGNEVLHAGGCAWVMVKDEVVG
jgi:DNA-directed RNA polymerase subunit RPC12/RpoP